MTALPFPLADPPDDAACEAGRLLFARGAEFLKGVVAMDGLPPADRSEVCFAGRSNVGKSSLINALTGRKALARTSSTPAARKRSTISRSAQTATLSICRVMALPRRRSRWSRPGSGC